MELTIELNVLGKDFVELTVGLKVARLEVISFSIVEDEVIKKVVKLNVELKNL